MAGFLAHSDASAQGYADDYRSALERLLQMPGDPNETFRYGTAAAEAGDASGVTASLERLLVFDPGLANLRLELGLLYLRVGSPALAEQYLRDALTDPDVPPDIRKRGLELLEEAGRLNKRWKFSGFASAGLRYDSNANAGPDGVVQFVTGIGEVQGRLRPEDTGQPDYSATFYLSGEARYDLGLQAGHQLVLPGLLYAEKYREQSQLDLAYGNLAPGIEFNLSHLVGQPAQVTVSTFLARLSRDNQLYLDEMGVFVDGAMRQGQAWLWRGGLGAKNQNFFSTDAAPLNDQRDGGLYSVFAGGVYDASARTQISVEILARRKTADVDFEAYREFGAIAQIRQLFDAGRLSKYGSWQAGLVTTYSVVDYDDLDLSIDLDTAQQDHRYRIEAQLSAPISASTGMVLRAGYYRNQSNFSIREYDDVYVAADIGTDF